MLEARSKKSIPGGVASKAPQVQFSCEECGTAYAIPEARVLGRILKIRCSRCRNVVEVFGPPAVSPPADAEPLPGERKVTANIKLDNPLAGLSLKRLKPSQERPERVAVKQDGGQHWFAAVRGRTLGPLSRDELIVLAKRGTVGARSYVWRPGMPRWERVERGADLAFLREEVRARLRQRSTPRPLTGMESGIFVMTGLFDRAALDQAVRQTPPALPAVRATQTSSPFDAAGAAAVEDAELGDWYVLGADGQQALFTDAEGPAVRGVTALATGRHMIRRRRSWLLAAALVATAALFVAGVLLVAWLTRDGLGLSMGAPAAGSAVGDATYAPSRDIVNKVRALLAPRPDPAPSARLAAHGEPAVRARVTARAEPSTPSGPTPVELDADWAASTSAPAALDLGAAAPAQGPEMITVAGLSGADVARVFSSRRPQLETCYTAALKRDSDLTGTLDLTVVVGRNGRVRRVGIPGGGSDRRFLTRCLEQRMRRWTFPKPDAELEVVLPLRLRPVL